MASVGGNSQDGITLNVMPLLDIFSILILFLLMSFSTDPESYDMSKDVELPESTTLLSLDEIPTVIITRHDIRVNDKVVAAVRNGDVEESARSQGAIYPLFKELEKLAEASKRFHSTKDKNAVPILTVEADKSHRFKLLKRVMLSAQQASFISFKFMVSKSRT